MIIYGLIDPRTGCLRYIGQTNDLVARWAIHAHDAKTKRHKCANWIRGLMITHGLKPTMEVLEEIADEQANDAERWWIASFRASGARLVNMTDGGEGRRGPMSESSKAKMRASAQTRWQRDEQRQAQSARALLRHQRDPQAVVKAGLAGRGVPHMRRA